MGEIEKRLRFPCLKKFTTSLRSIKNISNNQAFTDELSHDLSKLKSDCKEYNCGKSNLGGEGHIRLWQ
jgi:hypothetical protein